MRRPQHLPDFTDPPLNEVALGVQFAPCPAYSSVNARGIWELFKADFPVVEEHPRLEPQFETFGGANPQPSIQFQIGAPPVGSRLWFVSEEDSHLIQFQPDRFLANWRKRPNHPPYPRFEGIAGAFENNVRVLASHFTSEFSYTIDINQAEITYINIIPVEDFSKAGSWLSLWNSGEVKIEVLNTSFNEVIRDHDDKPYARFSHAIQSAFTSDGKDKVFRLSLTFRGKPSGNDVDAAMKFLKAGREIIVTRFDEITTTEAHEIWGKQE